jgi:hypothetical protein
MINLIKELGAFLLMVALMAFIVLGTFTGGVL